MDEDHFNHLVSLVSRLIKKEDTCMREAVSPAERVVLTLRFLATGESFHSLAFQFCISRHAISYIRSAVNLNVRFDWLNTEICVTLLHEMLQMVNTRRNLLRAKLQK